MKIVIDLLLLRIEAISQIVLLGRSPNLFAWKIGASCVAGLAVRLS
jgi:hypothetical protein